ncbi:MAG: hypothetical protein R6V12_18190, partial [Candidatus Hydrogenedentota bacterium]
YHRSRKAVFPEREGSVMRTRVCLTIGLLLGVVVFVVGCPWRVPALRLIFNQGTYGTYGFYSKTDTSVFFGGEQQVGDDFRLTGENSTITQVRWWGAYGDNTPVTDDFLLTIYRDNGTDMPEPHGFWEYRAEDLADRTATTGIIDPGIRDLTIYEYICDVEEWELEPDTTYYLSIVNDTGTWIWCTNGSATEGNTFCVIRDTWGEDWHDEASDMAFQLWSNE